MEQWRIEKSWISAIEGLLQLDKLLDDMSLQERKELKWAIQHYWDNASAEKKERIKKTLKTIKNLYPFFGKITI